MADRMLEGRRVLVVEDEYLLADELRSLLGNAGAIVLGPVGTLTDALALIEREARIDGTVLDVNLRGEMAFAAADCLRERGIPFLFTTGYDASQIPPRFADVMRWEKPINTIGIAQAVRNLFDMTSGYR